MPASCCYQLLQEHGKRLLDQYYPVSRPDVEMNHKRAKKPVFLGGAGGLLAGQLVSWSVGMWLNRNDTRNRQGFTGFPDRNWSINKRAVHRSVVAPGQLVYRNLSMKIHTTRFGAIDIEPDDILFFRNGLLGFEDCRHWVLLADSDNTAVAWLQSMQHSDIAMPVVSPRRFVEDYQVRLEPEDVELLQLTAAEQAFVLGVVSRENNKLTVNLRAPLVINLERRIGSQVVTVDQQPLQHDLATLPSDMRRSA